MRKYLLAMFILLVALSVEAQEFRKYANNFLYNGVDARGRSLGNAVSASSEDVFASYWNPAGLIHMDTSKTQLGYMHVFDGLYNYDVAGLAIPTKSRKGVIGFTAVRYGVDDIPNTIFLVDGSGNTDFNNITTFSSADYGGYLTFSTQVSKKLSLGGSTKVIHRSVGDFASAWGAGLDMGLKYKSYDQRFKAVAFARDILGTYTSWDFNFDDPRIQQVFLDTGNRLPEDGSIEATSPSLVLGFNYLFDIHRFTVSPEVDFDFTFDGERNTLLASSDYSVDPHAGIEVGYDDVIFIRAGVHNIQEVIDVDTAEKDWNFQPSGGAGFKSGSIEIDYALSQFDLRDDLTHLITLKLGFAKPKN